MKSKKLLVSGIATFVGIGSLFSLDYIEAETNKEQKQEPKVEVVETANPVKDLDEYTIEKTEFTNARTFVNAAVKEWHNGNRDGAAIIAYVNYFKDDFERIGFKDGYEELRHAAAEYEQYFHTEKEDKLADNVIEILEEVGVKLNKGIESALDSTEHKTQTKFSDLETFANATWKYWVGDKADKEVLANSIVDNSKKFEDKIEYYSLTEQFEDLREAVEQRNNEKVETLLEDIKNELIR